MKNFTDSFAHTPERWGTGSIKWDSQKRRFGVENLTPFWIADMDFPAAPCIIQALEKRLKHPVFGYTSPSDIYKKALCSWYQTRHSWELEAEWLLPTPNTVTVMTILLQALLPAGASCLVLTPVYDAFFTAIKGAGKQLWQFPMTENEGHYELDFGKLEQALAQGIECLLLCNPNNPGGKVWSREELEHIVNLCTRHNILIISDDVHCDWVFEPFKYTPVIQLPGAEERTIMITAPSKSFNLAGLNASCVVIAGEQLREHVRKLFEGMAIRGSNLFAYTAMEAAYLHAGPWLDEAREYVWKNAVRSKEYLEQTGIRCFRQESTFLMWLDCRSYGKGSSEICRALAREYGISVNDGGAYGDCGDGFIRFNIACSEATLETGLSALKQWSDNQ